MEKKKMNTLIWKECKTLAEARKNMSEWDILIGKTNTGEFVMLSKCEYFWHDVTHYVIIPAKCQETMVKTDKEFMEYLLAGKTLAKKFTDITVKMVGKDIVVTPPTSSLLVNFKQRPTDWIVVD